MHVRQAAAGGVPVVVVGPRPPCKTSEMGRDGARFRCRRRRIVFWRVFLLLCKWQLVVAAHFMIRGAGTAPARGVEVRVCTGLALRTSGISGSVSRAQGPDSLRSWHP